MMRGINRQCIFEDTEPLYLPPVPQQHTGAVFTKNILKQTEHRPVPLSPEPHQGSDGLQLQRVDKEQRNDILPVLLSRRAGTRQLQRLTGIGKNAISNISITILKQTGQ